MKIKIKTSGIDLNTLNILSRETGEDSSILKAFSICRCILSKIKMKSAFKCAKYACFRKAETAVTVAPNALQNR